MTNKVHLSSFYSCSIAKGCFFLKFPERRFLFFRGSIFFEAQAFLCIRAQHDISTRIKFSLHERRWVGVYYFSAFV